MLEIVNQLDGFDSRGNIKVLMATNRPDTLDPALIRPGRIDRKVGVAGLDCTARGCSVPRVECPSSSWCVVSAGCVTSGDNAHGLSWFQVEFGLPELEGRTHIFKIHTKTMSVDKDIRYELIARLCPSSTGAEIRCAPPHSHILPACSAIALPDE